MPMNFYKVILKEQNFYIDQTSKDELDAMLADTEQFNIVITMEDSSTVEFAKTELSCVSQVISHTDARDLEIDEYMAVFVKGGLKLILKFENEDVAELMTYWNLFVNGGQDMIKTVVDDNGITHQIQTSAIQLFKYKIE